MAQPGRRPVGAQSALRVRHDLGLTAVLFHVLGPQLIGSAESSLMVKPPRASRMLTRLLVDPQRFVSIDVLVDTLWSASTLPVRPSRAVHDVASDLRRALRRANLDQRIETRSDGKAYRLIAGPAEIDSAIAVDRLARGHEFEASGQPERAMAEFEVGLRLFRGEPYEEFQDEDFAIGERARLSEVHASLTQGWLLGLSERDASAFLAEVIGPATRFPERWRLWERWLVVLAQTGRQRQALAMFQDLRAILADSGLEPAPVLQELDRRIASNEFEPLAGSAPPAEPIAATTPGEVSMLTSVADLSSRVFVGRRGELRALSAGWLPPSRAKLSFVSCSARKELGRPRLSGHLRDRSGASTFRLAESSLDAATRNQPRHFSRLPRPSRS